MTSQPIHSGPKRDCSLSIALQHGNSPRGSTKGGLKHDSWSLAGQRPKSRGPLKPSVGVQWTSRNPETPSFSSASSSSVRLLPPHLQLLPHSVTGQWLGLPPHLATLVRPQLCLRMMGWNPPAMQQSVWERAGTCPGDGHIACCRQVSALAAGSPAPMAPHKSKAASSPTMVSNPKTLSSLLHSTPPLPGSQKIHHIAVPKPIPGSHALHTQNNWYWVGF